MPALDDKINVAIGSAQKAILQTMASQWQISLSDLVRLSVDDYARRNYPGYDELVKKFGLDQKKEVVYASTHA